MAITRRWQAGAEVDTTNSVNIEFDTYVNAFISSATQKKTGAYSYRCGGAAYSTAEQSLPATKQVRAGFHLYADQMPTSDEVHIFAFLDSARTELVTIQLTGSTKGMWLAVAGVEQDRNASCLLLPVWNNVGIDVKLDGSAGWVKVYVDGIEVLSFTGNTGTGDIELVRVGCYENVTLPTYWYLDDIYVDDTTGEGAAAVPPDLRFEYITPDGDGNYSQLDGSDGNQVDNYLQVDEQPHDGDTTYNEAQAADEKDSYAMTTKTLGAGWSVAAVIPCVIARKTDGGVASQFALMLREDGVDWEGSAQDLGTSYVLISERRATDPGDAAWDQTSLNGVEAGVWAEGTF